MLNRPEAMFDLIPGGMKFLVATDEVNMQVGGGGRSQTTGAMLHTADRGLVAVVKTGIGTSNIRFE